MKAKERKAKARDALDHRIAQALFAARFGSPEKPPAVTVDEAIDAYAAACVAEALDEWMAIVQLRLERCQKEKAMETVQK